MSDKKNCEYCGDEYYPAGGQWTTQKFCSISCKGKKKYHRDRSTGNVRSFKGGYPRGVVIRKWVEAQRQDLGTVGCHYCKKRVTPDNFVLDHKRPLMSLTKEQVKEESNLVVCCRECNVEKGSQISYEEFLERKNGESHRR